MKAAQGISSWYYELSWLVFWKWDTHWDVTDFGWFLHILHHTFFEILMQQRRFRKLYFKKKGIEKWIIFWGKINIQKCILKQFQYYFFLKKSISIYSEHFLDFFFKKETWKIFIFQKAGLGEFVSYSSLRRMSKKPQTNELLRYSQRNAPYLLNVTAKD